jgi:hypothetical protein
VGACFLAAVAAADPPRIWEPFDYPAGGLDGQSGDSEIGFSGSWSANSESVVLTNNLIHGELWTIGGQMAGLSTYVNRYGGARAIASSALTDAGLLTNGATLWFSVFLGSRTNANYTNFRLALALANDTFNQGNFNYWINDDGPQLGSGVGITLGRISGINGRAVATQFRDLSAGDGTAGNVIGRWTGAGTTVPHGNPDFFVGKITWGAGTNDVIEIYQPDAELNLGSIISSVTVDVDQSAFDTLTFARSDSCDMDEIRFGATSKDVMPLPPPLGTVIVFR